MRKKRIDVKTKGSTGEREIATLLNVCVRKCRVSAGLPPFKKEDEPFQRNQNQSAVGGDDLTNPFKLSIEVKRQERLALPQWWKQTVESAKRTDGVPILIYRQNNKQWKVIMECYLPSPWQKSAWIDLKPPVEVSIEIFLDWFSKYYLAAIQVQE